MNKQVFSVYQYLSPIKHLHMHSLPKLTEDCGKTEWWDENHTDRSDEFFSVLIIDNVPFNLWNLRSFTDKDGVEGSPAHLVSKLCSSSLGDLGSIGVPQMKKVGNTGVQSVSPFSRLLRWCHLPKKDRHSCPNLFSLSLYEDEWNIF